jgi:acyl-homoserine-lactone acylase
MSFRRFGLYLLFLLFLLGFLLPFHNSLLGRTFKSAEAKSSATEILWDTWGIPHIFAKNSTELFHAFGWAQMQNHGNLLLRLYGSARGQGAEYWGKENLAMDRVVWTMGFPGRAQEAYQLKVVNFEDIWMHS